MCYPTNRLFLHTVSSKLDLLIRKLFVQVTCSSAHSRSVDTPGFDRARYLQWCPYQINEAKSCAHVNCTARQVGAQSMEQTLIITEYYKDGNILKSRTGQKDRVTTSLEIFTLSVILWGWNAFHCAPKLRTVFFCDAYWNWDFLPPSCILMVHRTISAI